MSALASALQQSFQATHQAIKQFYTQDLYFTQTLSMVEAMADIFRQGRKIMVCGNGGSACQAMHFAEELTGRYRADRAALPALSLTDVSHVTCVGNDYGFDKIFSRAVEAYAQAGDGLLILSTSGNSANLLQAQAAAAQREVSTFALLGKGGGQLNGRCDLQLVAPGTNSDEIQNIHMLVIHALIEGVERSLFPQNYAV